jgi:hypothetical protein
MMSTIAANAGKVLEGTSVEDSVSSTASSAWSYASENPLLTTLGVSALALGMARQTGWFSNAKSSVQTRAEQVTTQVEDDITDLRKKAAKKLNPDGDSHMPRGSQLR